MPKGFKIDKNLKHMSDKEIAQIWPNRMKNEKEWKAFVKSMDNLAKM
ncbi:unknown; predicted coding region [Mycoplasmopsis pulmonis]|uniref:Uncharacterized protein n=1 Tax=Mycoplasmopsis pulmonis (strain UAB CTIP) TaxID=272635 RepID=Q98QG3_MYCPU|nr:hypothetical protein [Mycoplasmopsis pulmonis]CAC13576.1 unknown; predicted coding region [Mycoplasmopsis pulmonis]